jgi:hypothetical protein
MSLLDKQIPQILPGVAVGIGAALVTQLVVMGMLSLMRPLAKTAIKGGFIIKDATTGACSLAGSSVEKLTAKAETKLEAKPVRRLTRPKPGNPSLN